MKKYYLRNQTEFSEPLLYNNEMDGGMKRFKEWNKKRAEKKKLRIKAKNQLKARMMVQKIRKKKKLEERNRLLKLARERKTYQQKIKSLEKKKNIEVLH